MSQSAARIRYETAAGTDQGLVRSINQDVIYTWKSSQELIPPRAILLVADGMGGHKGGEVASRLAVEKHVEILGPILEQGEIEEKNIEIKMAEAMHTANKAISNYAIENDIGLQNIGTTLDCVVVIGMQAFISHIGDSRTYLLGKNGLTQLTTDHTAVSEMVEAGLIKREDIYSHPQRNILTQGLGGETLIEVEVGKANLSIGERILLCSDGLWGLVMDDILEKALLKAAPPQELITDLISAANQAGGDDNISAIICDILPA